MGRTEKRYDIFISYRRVGGELSAKMIRDKLSEMGYRVFFDVDSLKNCDFNEKLYSVIDGCKDFLIVLSPGALDRCVNPDGTPNDSDWVRKELSYALKQGKNVIPIMLNGFVMPNIEEAEALPADIRKVCSQNGITPDSSDFDSKMELLKKDFLISKPFFFTTLKYIISRKVLPYIIAAAVIAGCVGIGMKILNRNSGFPSTSKEKSVVEEVIYYMEQNLTYDDIMAQAVKEAISATKRYLSSGEAEYYKLEATYETSLMTIGSLDVGSLAASDGLIERVGELKNNPIPVQDVIAMNVSTQGDKNTFEDLINSLRSYMQLTMLPTGDKLLITESYEEFFEELLKGNAASANEILVNVTSEDVLSSFLYDYLPTLTTVPLSATGWSHSYDALESQCQSSYEKMMRAMNGVVGIVGSSNMTVNAMRENLINTYIMAGYSKEEAERYVDDMLADTSTDEEAEFLKEYPEWKELCTPADDDVLAALLLKMQYSLSLGLYNLADDCVAMMEKNYSDSDENLIDCLPTVHLFLKSAPNLEINYGVIVTGYPEEPNEVYQIGDIIIGYDGVQCRTDEDLFGFMDATYERGETDYQAAVLRLNDGGQFELITLDCSIMMPSIYVVSLTA